MASSSYTDNASIIRAAMKRICSKESKDGRTVKARLTILESFAAEFGTGVPWRRIVDFAISSNAFKHKDGGVRDSPNEATLKPNASPIHSLEQCAHVVYTVRFGGETELFSVLPLPDSFSDREDDASSIKLPPHHHHRSMI